ncbi:hypothetical protein AgCh_004953 [Apium graveolens]
METIYEEHENNNPHYDDAITTDEEEQVQEEDDEDNSEESSEEDRSSYGCVGETRRRILGSSSRMSWLREWDRVFPLISALCLFIDPTFFYILSVNEDGMCFYIDGWFALGLSFLRSVTDGLHIWNIWRQYRSSSSVHGVRKIYGGLALQNFKGKMDFLLFVFVILPLPQVKDNLRMSWGNNNDARSYCLQSSDNSQYDYGSFEWITLLVCNNSRVEKMLLPLFWGVMMLCTFGNLVSTDDWLEIVFMIIVTVCGLVLVTMLIGNIKVFLMATSSKKLARKVYVNNVDWWMNRRNMPQGLRQRVRNYERQRWIAMRGVDERDMIRSLPEGLRRDIKYHLCLDLVTQVPLFQHMDSLVLENICDRVTSLVFPKGEIVIKEGDPVHRMLFIVREILPPSSSTLISLEPTEAFGLEAEDVKYVTQHFRLNEKVKMSARYYSPGWRTWAAVTIQLAWLRHRLKLSSLPFIVPRRTLLRSALLGEERLRRYTAMLTSPKPHQDENVPRCNN